MKSLGLIGSLLTFVPLGLRGLMKGFAALNSCKTLEVGKPCLINGIDQSAILTMPWQEPWYGYSEKAIIVGAVLMAIAAVIGIIASIRNNRDSKRMLNSMDLPR